jgi:putative CocE/NonD family hydrolase
VALVCLLIVAGALGFPTTSPASELDSTAIGIVPSLSSLLQDVSSQVAPSVGSPPTSGLTPSSGSGQANAAGNAPSTPSVAVAHDSSWVPQSATYTTGSLLNIPVYASDGTALRVDVYYPLTSSGAVPTTKFPVLLQQTPYGKGNLSGPSALSNTDSTYLVDRGYVVVIADVRGTGTSGGTWGLFDPIQATDGAALVDWCARLPDSDGKVGLFGESYMGINQFLTVGALPQSNPVKAMFPVIAANDNYRDTATQGGLIDAEFDLFYLGLVAGLNASNPIFNPLETLGSNGSQQLNPELVGTEFEHNASLLSYLAPTAVDAVTGGSQAYDGRYWASRSPVNTLQKVVQDHIPAFLVGGWNDLFQRGELLNYTGLQNLYDGRAPLAPMTPNQPVTPRYQLLMGPWMHVTVGTGINMNQLELEWFDTWLLGQDTPLAHTTTPMHLYQLQSGNWLDNATWPIPAAPASQYYFGPGRSNSGSLSTNDGQLSLTPPSAPSGSDAVLWSGLSSACDIQTDQWLAGFLALASSIAHMPNPCDRNDKTLGAGPSALTYTTAPFPQAEGLAGPIDATIYATSTTTDTELVATIEAVSPSGQSEPLTSGALLGSMRAVDPAYSWYGANGQPLLPYHPYTQSSVTPVVRGEVTRYDIEVFPTFAQIPAGWRLRVTLTTADIPHLLPDLPDAAHLVGGIYQVQRNRTAASFLNVPLAPADAVTTPCVQICAP